MKQSFRLFAMDTFITDLCTERHDLLQASESDLGLSQKTASAFRKCH